MVSKENERYKSIISNLEKQKDELLKQTDYLKDQDGSNFELQEKDE